MTEHAAVIAQVDSLLACVVAHVRACRPALWGAVAEARLRADKKKPLITQRLFTIPALSAVIKLGAQERTRTSTMLLAST